jgi:hypothetical protein
MIKIFFHYTGAAIERILKSADLDKKSNFNNTISEIVKYGSSSMLGFNYKNPNHFLTFSNSQILQNKWAFENGISITRDWELNVLNHQIERFRPDVLFTVNPSWIVQNVKRINLRNLKCLAAWKASPISSGENYSLFDLGLSFNRKYLEMMKEVGVEHTRLHQFNFDFSILKNIQKMEKSIDLSFAGSYNDFMFSKRTNLLNSLYSTFFPKSRIRYYFYTPSKRFRGILPKIPLRFLPIYRSPVFLSEYLSVIQKSKIVFNCHSDITGIDKGNMRFFEVLGMKSFILTDKGNYPVHFVDGKDFISYSDEKDLIDKTKFFLKHEKEREEIAEHGYNTLKSHYNLADRSERLEEIFRKFV